MFLYKHFTLIFKGIVYPKIKIGSLFIFAHLCVIQNQIQKSRNFCRIFTELFPNSDCLWWLCAVIEITNGKTGNGCVISECDMLFWKLDFELDVTWVCLSHNSLFSHIASAWNIAHLAIVIWKHFMTFVFPITKKKQHTRLEQHEC